MAQNSTLRLRRIGRGMTQAELARLVGISQQLMSKLEAGTISLTPARAQKLAQVLGCSAIDLLPDLAASTPNAADETELLRNYRALAAPRRAMLLNFARVLHMQGDDAPPPRANAN